MKKKDIINSLSKNSKIYDVELKGKNIIFIYDKKGKIDFFETKFSARNFAHLTGVKLNNLKVNDFYKKCVTGRITEKDFELKKDGTTILKIDILPKIVKIHKTAKMVGDFNNKNLTLKTDKIAGTINACLGFIKENDRYYVPNTALKDDIRDKIIENNKILAIIRKEIKDDYYHDICYIHKDFNINKIEGELKKLIKNNNIIQYSEVETLGEKLKRKPTSIIDNIQKKKPNL